MTVFTAIRSAALRTTGAVITSAFGNSEQIAIEMTDLVDEVAKDIVASHDWRVLIKIATITGTGVENYALPADFARMVSGSEIDDASNWFWGYEPFATVNDWLRFKTGSYAITSPGGWIAIGGELQFYPVPVGAAQYPYISSAWARSALGVEQSAFQADSDTFALPERLLTLALIWRWQSQKGMDYAEDMATYEMALSQEQARERGARVYRTQSAVFGGVPVAYSGRAPGW